MTDFTLTLGGIAFQDFEVPDRITGFGGEHVLTIHQLIGGRRIIDAMGASRAPLEWTGRFRGKDALTRARAIEQLWLAGATVSLALGDISDTVVIREFRYDFERFYEVPYNLRLEVLTADVSATTPGVDEMIGADNTTAQGLGDEIGDTSLTGFLTSLDGAISSVSNFASATQAEISAVLAPIAQVQSRVTTLIATAENTLNSVTTLGGVLPNNPVSTGVASLEAQFNAMSQASGLYSLQATVGRMQGNLAAIGASGAQVTVGGGNLFAIAEDAYGDATAWATIAAANGLTDPVVSGVKTILVPPSGGSTGGVLQ
jgi:hypothetical protein